MRDDPGRTLTRHPGPNPETRVVPDGARPGEAAASKHDRDLTGHPSSPGASAATAVHDLRDLRRSTTDRKLAGVAGGLGRHFDLDPTVLRVAFVVLALFGGAGVLLYGVAWLIVPEEGSEHAVIRTSPSTRVALLAVAAVLSAAALVSHSFGHWWFPWPLAVIAVVVLLIWMNRDKNMNRTPAPPAPPAGAPSTGQAPAEGWAGEDYAVPPPPPPYSAPPSGYQPPPRRTRRGPLLFAPTLALLAVALGGLGLYDALGGSVVAAAYPALALAVIGGMLVLGAWVGRAGGLVALGLAAAVVLAGTSVVSPHWQAGRQRNYAPTSATAVHDGYFLSAGQIRLDLTRVTDPATLDGRTIGVHMRAGQIIVVLPPGVRAHVDANVSLGEVWLDGQRAEGPRLHVVRDLGSGPTTVDLDLGTYVGRIAVRHASGIPQAFGRQSAGLLTQGAA